MEIAKYFSNFFKKYNMNMKNAWFLVWLIMFLKKITNMLIQGYEGGGGAYHRYLK